MKIHANGVCRDEAQLIFIRGVVPEVHEILCENSVRGSTWLTPNGREDTEINYLSGRPERCRRAPKVFSHSLPLGMTAL
jgi:hypothetical protein